MAELRKLLAIPKNERPSNWQEIVAPNVGALCADFAKQEDSATALVQISLIAMAAQKGSKDAKKRNLKPARWIASPPPSLSNAFDDLDEARAAVRILQLTKADWVESYICGELTKNKWPPLTVNLIGWLLKGTATVEGFLKAINKTQTPANLTYPAWIADTLSISIRLLGKSPQPSGGGLMAEVVELASKISTLGAVGSTAAIQREQQQARFSVLSLLSLVSSSEPSILVQGAAIAAIRSLSASSIRSTSALSLGLELLCKRTFSVLSILVPLADKASLTHYRALWDAHRESYPRADQLLKNASKDIPALHLLQRSAEEDAPDSELAVTANLETILCNLVANWDDYYPLHRMDPAAQQLSLRIDDLIRQLGVARFGNIGETLPYDPLRHFLSDTSAPPAKVLIKKIGLVLERSDGTSRVLLRAMVSPAGVQ